VHVAGSAVEIAQLGWPRCHRGFREDEHGDGEHLPLSCGYEHRVSVQRGPAVLGGAAIRLGCRRSALAWWCAKALPVPHGTDTSSAAESGQGVFGCCRVVFNDALRGRDKAYRAGVKLSDSEIFSAG
jgi:hypothetical protein